MDRGVHLLTFFHCPLLISYATQREALLVGTLSLIILLTAPLWNFLLHFAWGVAEAKCIWPRLSVCLSLTTFPHYCTDPDVTWGMVGVLCSCALLGGFAVSARVSLLWQHKAEREMSASACTHSMPGFTCVVLHALGLLKPLLRKLSFGPSICFETGYQGAMHLWWWFIIDVARCLPRQFGWMRF